MLHLDRGETVGQKNLSSELQRCNFLFFEGEEYFCERSL